MKDVNPVTVLKTAIQLHQRQPRRERHLGASSTATVTTFSPTAQAHSSPSPVVPTQQHFTQKLENLKKVLPFANEVKLASLLARAQGDMDAVVQEILDSSNDPEVEHTHDAAGEVENLRIIDLTGPDDDEKCFTETTTAKSAERIKQLASMPVETAALRDIIKTVEENDAAKAYFNLYSFHKPEKSATNVNVFKSMEENRYSQQLSTMQHVNPRECPYCFKSISTDQQGSFCNFCGGIFPKNYTRW